MPLVSRRFSEACRDPTLWRELRVLHRQFRTEARWQSFLRWLAVRASWLQTFMLNDDEAVRSSLVALPDSQPPTASSLCTGSQRQCLP